MTVIIQYDDGYDCRFYERSILEGVIGAVTTMFGRDSFRHGYKLIEVYELCD